MLRNKVPKKMVLVVGWFYRALGR